MLPHLDLSASHGFSRNRSRPLVKFRRYPFGLSKG